jgi:hypothetical protein
MRSNFNTDPPTEAELVPSTTRQVVMLKPVPSIDDKLSEKGESLSASNELVVVYRMNGKFYYNTARKFTILEPAALQ